MVNHIGICTQCSILTCLIRFLGIHSDVCDFVIYFSIATQSKSLETECLYTALTVLCMVWDDSKLMTITGVLGQQLLQKILTSCLSFR